MRAPACRQEKSDRRARTRRASRGGHSRPSWSLAPRPQQHRGVRALNLSPWFLVHAPGSWTGEQRARDGHIRVHGGVQIRYFDELVSRMGDVYRPGTEQERLAPSIEERNVSGIRKNGCVETWDSREPRGSYFEDVFDRHARLERCERAPHHAG